MRTALILAVFSFAVFAQTDTANPVPRLLENLDSLDEHTSGNAARSLGIVFKSKDTSRDQLQQAVVKLIEKMDSSKWTRVRLECINALGEIRAQSAVDPLKAMMQHDNSALANSAASAIAKILHVDAARALFKEMGGSPTEHVRRVSYNAMVNLATQDDVPFLVSGMESSNWRIQVDALRGLERASAAGARLDADIYGKITAKLGNEVANVAEAAGSVLIRVRSLDGINALIGAADAREGDIAWRVRTNALRALNRIGFPRNERALSVIIRNLDDRTANVQREVRTALNQVKSNHGYFRTTPEKVAPAAERFLYPRFLDELERAESLTLRSKIIDEMGTGNVHRNLATRVAEIAATTYTDAAAANATKLQYQCLELLGSAGATGVDSALSASLGALQEVLAAHGDKSTGDATFRARSRALRALKTIGYPRNRAALPAIIRQLDDQTSNVLNEARSLIQQARQRDANALFGILLSEYKAAEDQRLKAKVLRQMGSDVPSRYASEVSTLASEALADAMGKADLWEMRAGAVTVLGGTSTTGDIELIAQCVGDDEPTVRNAAGEALARLAEFCEPTESAAAISTLLPWIRKSVDWRKAAIAARALGHYPTPDALDPLVHMLGHSVVNVKESASFALVHFANSADESLTRGVEEKVLAAMTADAAKWEYGAPVLGALRSKAALPQLLTILRSDDWRAQVNAVEAVLAINAADTITEKTVSDAVVSCTLSRVRQVQETANRALRILTPER